MSHIGHYIPGKGSGAQFLHTKKLNVKSSTDGERIGVDIALSKILWPRYFIYAQGYKSLQNKLMQDNNSSILLENNGNFYRSNQTKHIKTRHLFLTDRVEQGGL